MTSPQRQRTTRTTDASIDSTGVLLRRNAPGETAIAVAIDATEAASYAIDVSHDGETWREGEVTYTDTADVDDAFVLVARHLRVRVTASASAGATADVTIEEAR